MKENKDIIKGVIDKISETHPYLSTAKIPEVPKNERDILREIERLKEDNQVKMYSIKNVKEQLEQIESEVDRTRAMVEFLSRYRQRFSEEEAEMDAHISEIRKIRKNIAMNAEYKRIKTSDNREMISQLLRHRKQIQQAPTVKSQVDSTLAIANETSNVVDFIGSKIDAIKEKKKEEKEEKEEKNGSSKSEGKPRKLKEIKRKVV